MMPLGCTSTYGPASQEHVTYCHVFFGGTAAAEAHCQNGATILKIIFKSKVLPYKSVIIFCNYVDMYAIMYVCFDFILKVMAIHDPSLPEQLPIF